MASFIICPASQVYDSCERVQAEECRVVELRTGELRSMSKLFCYLLDQVGLQR